MTFIRSFTTKPSQSDITESLISPTSVLDANKPFFPPFDWYERNLPKSPQSPKITSGSKHQHCWENSDSSGGRLGLIALVDSIADDSMPEPTSEKPNNKKRVLLGAKPRIQIPPFSHTQAREFTGSLSVSEMELSENYTCVTSHGPNPKTIHIFDDCIVESSCGELGSLALKKRKENQFQDITSVSQDSNSHRFNNILSFCYNCRKTLGHGNDIYMYRGEKAFCSNECREEEIMFDEDNNSEWDHCT